MDLKNYFSWRIYYKSLTTYLKAGPPALIVLNVLLEVAII